MEDDDRQRGEDAMGVDGVEDTVRGAPMAVDAAVQDGAAAARAMVVEPIDVDRVEPPATRETGTFTRFWDEGRGRTALTTQATLTPSEAEGYGEDADIGGTTEVEYTPYMQVSLDLARTEAAAHGLVFICPKTYQEHSRARGADPAPPVRRLQPTRQTEEAEPGPNDMRMGPSGDLSLHYNPTMPELPLPPYRSQLADPNARGRVLVYLVVVEHDGNRDKIRTYVVKGIDAYRNSTHPTAHSAHLEDLVAGLAALDTDSRAGAAMRRCVSSKAYKFWVWGSTKLVTEEEGGYEIWATARNKRPLAAVLNKAPPFKQRDAFNLADWSLGRDEICAQEGYVGDDVHVFCVYLWVHFLSLSHASAS